ncbi:MAG TPA: hypothetical protein HA362_01115 [Nanoarchaeota archaeon]|nr:hypothetical protein [Nanoarchaeota archaeon]
MANFDEFIRTRAVVRQSPDRPRAEFLVKESANSYFHLLEMISKISITDSNANDYIKSCYDIVMEMIRAKMLLGGYKASGKGAHEAEVSYMRNIGFKEADVQFADQIRYFRNGMLYYGTIQNKEYAEKVIEFTKRIYPKLKRILAASI